MERFKKPCNYLVRLYVLRGLKLTPMDMGFNGTPGKSDPYLRVRLGNFVFDDRKNAIDDKVDVDLYKLIEIDAALPGHSQLIIEVKYVYIYIEVMLFLLYVLMCHNMC